MNNFLLALRRWNDFHGRSARMEFWLFQLVNGVGTLLAIVVDNMVIIPLVAFPVLSLIWMLALLIPSISVQFRRLHDTGRTAWWLLISGVPLIGPLTLLVFYLLRSQPGDNRFGPPAPTPASTSTSTSTSSGTAIDFRTNG